MIIKISTGVFSCALARFFQNLQKWSKIGQKCPKVSKSVLEWSKSIFQVFEMCGSLLEPLGHFWKKRAKGHVSLLPNHT